MSDCKRCHGTGNYCPDTRATDGGFLWYEPPVYPCRACNGIGKK